MPVIKALNSSSQLLPGYAPGRVYPPHYIDSTGDSIQLVANRLHVIPYFISVPCTLQSIKFNINGPSSAGSARFGIYKASGASPSNLLIDAGIISTSTSGENTINSVANLSTGWVFIGINPDENFSISGEYRVFGHILGQDSTGTFSGTGTPSAPHNYGPLPSPCPAVSASSSASAVVFLTFL